MSHPLVLALYATAEDATSAAGAVHRLGVDREHLSVVAGSLELEAELAGKLDASPGAEIDESVLASRLGELGARLVAAVALVLPGIGPIVAAGPLGAEFASAVGHVAGGVGGVLTRAGLDAAQAAAWEAAIADGGIVLGAHVVRGDAGRVLAAMKAAGARDEAQVTWKGAPD